MVTRCEHCPLRRFHLFKPMSDSDVKAMQKFKVGELIIEAGTPVLSEGSNSPQLFTALYGMGLRYKHTSDGERQVVNFVFPGDFVGLQAGVMGEMSHSVEASSKMTLCVFNRSELWGFFKSYPERAFDLTWLSAVEEHFLGEALTSLGQRSALESLSWALLRMFMRCERIGLVQNRRMAMPFRQQDLADALGLSLVHTNKTLSKLRDQQLADWSDGHLTINDKEKLAAIAKIELDVVPVRPLM
ncbi:cAMP-binding domain of CRP or a regulatory subunit of cAMP-dependent protein kinases [Loktanella fryxellensis]|uniref:cAMP-binding domain of CRP or a regulatory subunit of cAMP-dependent protein kinases n=1 Tax=Loktanella fryxellensis TaxID=245187 RepID=A0A1H8D0H1_9RHOB|nr:Crp/Fnr family transcriptional regulator [Loktanella fryxellensis]SEN00144.1 cAMP-binding domain of CRP or a regulatory subunit of cAMP-dependent protein kinases [Loktanella fryxellensis]